MDALLANTIHAIKNTLHALNSKLSEAERLAPTAPLAQARTLSGHVNTQLVQLLTLYREEEGNLRLAIDDHDLFNFVDELRMEPTGQNDGTISVDYELNALETIGTWAFDAYQVKLLLADALRNALRHARHQVRLSVRPADHGGIEFTVCDDGAGFPAQILAGDEAAMGANGSGLGLRFARLIAERHVTPNGRHGTVLLDNGGLNGGARLRLQLP